MQAAVLHAAQTPLEMADLTIDDPARRWYAW